jgi:ABC-type transport system involved in cytochrome bd biosynthesis fused ATPase/permease subunit
MDDVLDAADGRSVLLITHRAEGLERMDEIVALDAT